MSLRIVLLRLLAGCALLLVLLAGLFALTLPAIHRWGATDAELALALPGDELLPRPQLAWTNAATIDAPPARVWPWVAQLGDSRGGFYSFTFIENRVGALTGAADYTVVYRNADRVVPEWQDPRPGDPLIQGSLNIEAVEPGAWLLGNAPAGAPFGWTWLWRVAPADGGRTRLLVRMRIQTEGAAASPAVGLIMDAGGFVMEQRMLHGIALRAEGGAEPAWAEGAEIALWLAALLAGLVAAGLFVLRPGWRRPLAVAAAAVVLLFVLTFVQPPLWARLGLDAALIAGVWWAWRSPAPSPTYVQAQPAHM